MFILPVCYAPRKATGSKNYIRESELFCRNNVIINWELNS